MELGDSAMSIMRPQNAAIGTGSSSLAWVQTIKCTTSPAGSYTNFIGRSTVGGPCPAGYQCPAGTVCNGGTNNICTNCNYFSPNMCDVANRAPTICPTGYWAAAGSSSCTKCPDSKQYTCGAGKTSIDNCKSSC